MITAEQFAIALREVLAEETGEGPVPEWAELSKERRQYYIRAASKLLTTILAPAPVKAGGTNAHTYFRRLKRVQAYQYNGDGADAEELNALLHKEEAGVYFDLRDHAGQFLMRETIYPEQWLCVVPFTGETYVIDKYDFSRDYTRASDV